MFYVILNPWSGKGRAGKREPEVRTLLQAHGMPFELARTTKVGEATALARKAAERGGYTAVVAAGGDGTIHEVANGLVGTDTPLGVLPIGTGNDFAKIFGLSYKRLEQAVRMLRNSTPRQMDVGAINGHYFVNGVGAGLDAQVAVEAAKLKTLSGLMLYLLALTRALRHFAAPEMAVSFNGQTIKRRMLLVSAGIGRCHGGGFWLTPDAQIDDGLFDICLVDRLSLPEIVRHIPKVLRGRHTTMQQVCMGRASEVVIESTQPFAVHLDGEILGTEITQLDVRLLPGALKIRV